MTQCALVGGGGGGGTVEQVVFVVVAVVVTTCLPARPAGKRRPTAAEFGAVTSDRASGCLLFYLFRDCRAKASSAGELTQCRADERAAWN